MERNEDSERVVVQKGLSVLVVQKEIFRHEPGSSGRTTTIFWPDKRHGPRFPLVGLKALGSRYHD